MHHRSLSELQGVSSQQGAWALRTTQDGASRWGPRLRKGGSARCCLSPPRAGLLWVWLLLGALVVPGAWSFLSEEQEELLVELHNRYRGVVSPTASAMLPLKWDPSLKLIAEGYAAKCIWNHNPELEETGENLYASTKVLDLHEALEEWFLEHLSYDFNNNSCDEDKMCGHYTQMVWADTHRVGCAVHLCNDMEGLNWEMPTHFLVCNYYPAGNYEGERPYVEGDWCSRCPENLQKCENNLCVYDTVEETEETEETEDDVDEGGEEDMTEIPATTKPTVLPDEEEEREEEAVVPPPAATDLYTQPPTTTATPTTSTTIPITTSIPTTAAEEAEEAVEEVVEEVLQEVVEEVLPENTPAPGTQPPEEAETTPEGQEEVEVKMIEDVVEEKKTEEDEQIKPAEKAQRDVVGKIFPNIIITTSAASVCGPSVLLACLMGVLTLRL
ncbi:peptidase inhibitor 16-like [Cheilinus undulatus]|uniref:peptidase inhibitor 16-like n=1 Tax=Cheilinus undulatus TaxID=241271 RepID=UPI001BD4DF1F|nr:peptidase inhibitor 16-like [Cheilinus undulatus]